MKKRKLLLIGLLVWNINSVLGQSCGTPHPINPTIYPKEDTNLQARGSSSALCIDVFFHIVRNTNGTNAFATPNLDAIVNNLNEFYSPHNIIINNAGSDFINNSNFVNIDNDNEARNLGQTNNRNDAINYYIVETLWSVNGGFITGTANSIPSNNLVIRRDRVLTSTSPHELGHCLNLLHTHETARGVEAINGSNCSSAGDLVCDTPADPRLGTNNVNGNCEYFGGNGFNPLTNNIMSYSRGHCRDEFTNGQGHRMRYAIRNESVLQNIGGNSCTSISEVNNICYPQKSTITLSNLDGAITTWNTSNNVLIVSKNNSSAQIRALNSSSSGNGWIRATLSNETILQEDFWIGKPKALTRYPDPTICTNVFVQPNPYSLPVSPGASTYSLTSNSPYLWVDNFATPNIDVFMGATQAGNYTVTLTTSNSCGSSQATIYVTAENCWGGGFFSAYPNPTSNTLTIQNMEATNALDTPKSTNKSINLSNRNNKTTITTSNINTFYLHDFSGNMVLSGKLKDITNINVSSLKKGTYILKIHVNGGIETHQIIIK